MALAKAARADDAGALAGGVQLGGPRPNVVVGMEDRMVMEDGSLVVGDLSELFSGGAASAAGPVPAQAASGSAAAHAAAAEAGAAVLGRGGTVPAAAAAAAEAMAAAGHLPKRKLG